jgi:hypothetical protein
MTDNREAAPPAAAPGLDERLVREWFARQRGGLRPGGDLHSDASWTWKQGYKVALDEAEPAILYALRAAAPQAGPDTPAHMAVREAYSVIDELAPEWSGSSLGTVLRNFLTPREVENG